MREALPERVALVTGASSGIGRAISGALVGSGARVALVARDGERLDRAAAELGVRAEAFATDVTSCTAVAGLVDRVQRSLGAPSILDNAAGVFGPITPVVESDPEEWAATLQVNLVAPYLLCRAFAPAMVAAGWGRIFNVTSAASLHPPGPLNSAYGTSKVALNQFTRHLAAELDGTGVTVNAFHPGDVKTAMWGDIRDRADALGEAGAAYREWVAWVEETGGDPPEKAAELILEQVTSEAPVTGRFLWIRDPLQAPIPSWDEPAIEDRPWAG